MHSSNALHPIVVALAALSSGSFSMGIVLRKTKRLCEETDDCLQTSTARASSVASSSHFRLRGTSEFSDALISLGSSKSSICPHCEPEHVAQYRPVFSRLHSWITVFASKHIPAPMRELFADIFQKPSPRVLLVSWIIIAATITAYCANRSDRINRVYALIGSILMACLIGGLEESDVTTVVLLDIPWCLAIEMLVYSIVQNIAGLYVQEKSQPEGRSYNLLPPSDMEKMAKKGHLF